MSNQKLKVDFESSILLKSVLDTFYIVKTRKQPNSYSSELSQLLLEKFDTF